MSSEEALRLCQILASLNYKGQRIHITPDLFQKPNINLVYDIINWSLNILDDRKNVEQLREEQPVFRMSDLDEAGRVSCLINVARRVSKLLGIKLDLVALYCANTTCCPELLKIVEPIYESAKLAVDKKNKFNNQQPTLRLMKGSDGEKNNFPTESQIMMKQVLELINQKGGIKELSDEVSSIARDLDLLIGNEEKHNEERLRVMDRRLELTEIERVLRNAHEDIVTKTNVLAKSNEELDNDLLRLDERLKLKELELDGVKDQLNDLLFQSPAYVERYEKLHETYEKAYANYVSKYRNLMYLKSCVYLKDDHDYDEDGDATTDPPRLLESLLEGNSKPISASSELLDATGDGVENEAELASKETAGLERKSGLRDENVGRKADDAKVGDETPADAGLGLGLELEGLLNEFVVETSGVNRDESSDDNELDEETGDDNELDEETGDESSAGNDDDDDDDVVGPDRG